MSDDALRLEYERRKEKLYNVPEQARVAEIVIRFDAERIAAARQERRRADRGGPREGRRPARRSRDGSRRVSEGNARDRGGDLGTVAKGELRARRSTPAVFVEPAGGVSRARPSARLDPPVPRDRAQGRAGYRPFSEVKEDLRKRIADDLYEKRYEEYIGRLRRDAFIKIYDQELAKLEEKKT